MTEKKHFIPGIKSRLPDVPEIPCQCIIMVNCQINTAIKKNIKRSTAQSSSGLLTEHR